jgi:hypothetical protein
MLRVRMIKYNKFIISVFVFLVVYMSGPASAQDRWPRELKTESGAIITIYQPTPETLEGDKLKLRTAIAVKMSSSDAPKFGAVWADAKLNTDRERRIVTLESITITDVKFPGEEDQAKITKLKAFLENEVPKGNYEYSLDKLLTSIEQENIVHDAALKNDPPTIYFRKEATVLVIIDGEPKVQKDDKMNMERVVNTAFLIVKSPEDSRYYLYSGLWYSSSDTKQGWTQATKLPSSIESLAKQVKEHEDKTAKESGAKPPAKDVSKIIVSTTPAELIQSKGEPNFKPIDKTKLLYLSNSEDDVFMDIESQKYFVLLSGRWYSSAKLDGGWKFVEADKLPSDFARIPEGSAKDGVLASVAGTAAAREAVMDAQVPQTAAVDKATAKCTVTYNGEPKFEKIEGTSLELAVNTSTTVMRSGDTYYALDNAIWFKSSSPKGPWTVSEERPKEVDKIPPSSSAYNSKYVYIYDTSPTTVYVGYTPGYTGSYVYGPTVVYGTGYYYNPWYGPYYYPRPYTYGFGMCYSPYAGWGFSMSFHFGFYGGYGGYWGPPMYRPPYYGYGGYGGYGNRVHNGNNNIIINNGNIYNRTEGARPSTRPSNTGGNVNRPSTGVSNPIANTGGSAANRPNNSLPGGSTANRPSTGVSNNMMTDKSGNVYNRDSKGNWNQNTGSSWSRASQDASSRMNTQNQMSNRGSTRMNNYNSSSMSRSSGGGYRGGGGGGRGGGGRGR